MVTVRRPLNEIFFIDISDDDGASWVSLETVGPVAQSTGGWFEVSFLVADYVDNTDSVRVRRPRMAGRRPLQPGRYRARPRAPTCSAPSASTISTRATRASGPSWND